MSDERKVSLGEFLKAEREKRGLTIEQTASATKIGLKILKQLEADRYSELPALPFVRGFVRNYGKFLGIDGDKLLQEYASFLEDHARERPKRDAGHSGYAFERPEGEQSRKILWGVMAGMLVFGGAVVFIFKPSLKHKHHGPVDKLKPVASAKLSDEGEDGETPVVDPSASPSPLLSPSPGPSNGVAASATPGAVLSPSPVVTSAPIPVVTSTPTSTPTPPTPTPTPTHSTATAAGPTPLPSNGTSDTTVALTPEQDLDQDKLQSGANYPTKEVKHRIIFRAKADVWVRYQCDDKRMMKFALKKDRVLVLRGKNAVRFQVSNPESISFRVGGKAESVVSEASQAFAFHGNTTLVWPPEPVEKTEENFKVGAALPATAAPSAAPLTE